jgi:hypothetical protein
MIQTNAEASLDIASCVLVPSERYLAVISRIAYVLDVCSDFSNFVPSFVKVIEIQRFGSTPNKFGDDARVTKIVANSPKCISSLISGPTTAEYRTAVPIAGLNVKQA